MATGHVYVIEAEGGPVKIGVAINPSERLKQLQTGAASRLRLAHVEPALNGHAGEIERAAHQLLAERRAHGEWFNVTVPDARGAIAAAMAGERVQKPSSRLIRNKHLSGQVELSPHLCRTARGILGWTRNDLAAATGLSAITLGAFESRDDAARMTKLNNRAAVEAFERAGLQFIPENGGGEGIRFRDRRGEGKPAE